jgi:hypothetical protein
LLASDSRLHREHFTHFRNRLAVIKPIGKHPKRQRLRAFDRFFARLAVGQYARKIDHLRDPAAVIFAFDLDS